MSSRCGMPLLVTGASGQLGKLVLKELIEQRSVAPSEIIATTRRPKDLAAWAAMGVSVRLADFDDPASLKGAFSGAKRLLLISTTPDHPPNSPMRRRMAQHTAAIEAAAAADVEHIIYTSAPNPEPPTPCFWKADHYDTEQVIERSGLGWTILRMWEYPDWHVEHDWSKALSSGEWLTAAGAGRCAYIAREDCARAVAGALLADCSANRRYDVTGPEALTIDDVMRTLGEVSGRSINVVHLGAEEFERRLVAEEEPLATVYAAFDRGMQRGSYDGVTNAVEQLTGKKPRTLREFLQSALAADAQGHN